MPIQQYQSTEGTYYARYVNFACMLVTQYSMKHNMHICCTCKKLANLLFSMKYVLVLLYTIYIPVPLLMFDVVLYNIYLFVLYLLQHLIVSR